MKYCEKCQVDVRGQEKHCPLCQAELSGKNEVPPYPRIPTIFKEFSLFFKVILIIIIGAGVICVFLNLLLPNSGIWSAYVILGLLYFWMNLYFALSKKRSIFKHVMTQTLILVIFALVFDLITGWHAWSINFFLPIVCSVALISLAIIAKVKKVPTEGFAIYFALTMLLGLIPLTLLLLKIVTIPLPTFICLTITIISLAGIMIIEGDNFLEEIQKRFHI